MKSILLSLFLIALSCNTTKQKTDDAKVPSNDVAPKKSKMIKQEELIAILSNTASISSAKKLITNSGLSWEGLTENSDDLKIAKIKVPANKKDFWIQQLQNAGEFKKVLANTPNAAKKMRGAETSSFLKLEKTPCFGDCPTFEASISKDGKVTFIGKKHVLKSGKTDFLLTPEQFTKLKTLLSKKDFNSYKGKYDNPRITDLPSTFIIHNGKKVEIRVWKDAPSELINVHEFLDGLFLDKKLYK